MTEVADLFVVLRAVTDPFAKGMKKVAADAEAAATKTSSAFAKVAKLGKTTAEAVLVTGAASVKLAMDFDQQMALVHTQAGASLAEVSALSGKVLALAGTVGIGPTTLAEGLYHVESAGFRGAKAMDILTAAAKTATIGQSDLETTSQALIGVMASQIGGVKSAADAAAYLNTTVGIGDMRMDKLAQAIATGVLPSFRNANLQMNDFSAALATLTDNVTPADEAATRLRMTVALMSAPSKKAQGALAQIGIGATTLADDMKKPDGLLVAVDDLKSHLAATFGPQAADDVNHYTQLLQTKGVAAANAWADKSSQAAAVLEDAFGGGRSSAAILTLIGESDRLKDKYAALGDSASRAKSFQDAWATQQSLFSQRLKDLGASAEALGIKIGNKLIPVLAGLLGWMSKHTTTMKVFAGVLAAVAAGSLMAWLGKLAAKLFDVGKSFVDVGAKGAKALGSLAKGAGKLSGTLADVGKALGSQAWSGAKVAAGNVGALAKNFATLSVEAGKKFVAAAAEAGKAFAALAANAAKAGVALLASPWTWVVLGAVAVGVAVYELAAHWKAVWGALKTSALAVWHALESAWRAVWDAIRTAALTVWNGLATAWRAVWGAVSGAIKGAWDDVLKPTFGFIEKYGIDPVKDAIQAFKKAWDSVWNGIQTVVQDVWKVLKPIFDAFKTAFGWVEKGASWVSKGFDKVGKWLGFDQGGWVPGTPGAPLLAVVHGGEFVVSRDMLAGRAATPIRLGAAASGGGGATTVVVTPPDIYIDGKKLNKALTTRAQRTKKRNGQTFYS